jgi:hypothetical protein
MAWLQRLLGLFRHLYRPSGALDFARRVTVG